MFTRSYTLLTRNARRPLLRTAVAQAMNRSEQSKNLVSAEVNLMVGTVDMSASSMNGLLVLRLLEGGDEDAIPISPDQSHSAVKAWKRRDDSMQWKVILSSVNRLAIDTVLRNTESFPRFGDSISHPEVRGFWRACEHREDISTFQKALVTLISSEVRR